MELAGASTVYTPRHILAAALAAHASGRLDPRIRGLDQLAGAALSREFRVLHGAAPVDISGLNRDDLSIVGCWVRGRLEAAAPGARAEPGSILIAIGSPAGLARTASTPGLKELPQEGPFVICGFGEVGRKVHELLTDAGEEVITIDRAAHPGVSITGNILDPAILRAAGIERAQGVVLALDSDDATLFATVIARDLSPAVPIVARVNTLRNVATIDAAGADYALSLSGVAGDMLSTSSCPMNRTPRLIICGSSPSIRRWHRQQLRWLPHESVRSW